VKPSLCRQLDGIASKVLQSSASLRGLYWKRKFTRWIDQGAPLSNGVTGGNWYFLPDSAEVKP